MKDDGFESRHPIWLVQSSLTPRTERPSADAHPLALRSPPPTCKPRLELPSPPLPRVGPDGRLWRRAAALHSEGRRQPTPQRRGGVAGDAGGVAAGRGRGGGRRQGACWGLPCRHAGGGDRASTVLVRGAGGVKTWLPGIDRVHGRRPHASPGATIISHYPSSPSALPSHRRLPGRLPQLSVDRRRPRDRRAAPPPTCATSCVTPSSARPPSCSAPCHSRVRHRHGGRAGGRVLPFTWRTASLLPLTPLRHRESIKDKAQRSSYQLRRRHHRPPSAGHPLTVRSSRPRLALPGGLPRLPQPSPFLRTFAVTK
jgi:hypothetical protein